MMAELKVNKRSSKNKPKKVHEVKKSASKSNEVESVESMNNEENEVSSDEEVEVDHKDNVNDGDGKTAPLTEVKLTKRERKKAKNKEKLKLINANKKQSKLLKKQEVKDENFVRNVKKLYETLIKDDFAFIARAHHNHPRPAFDENGDRIYYNDESVIDDYANSHLIDNADSELKEKWEHGKPKTTRAKTYSELKARFNAKMEEFRIQKEGKGDEKKKKKKIRKKEDKSDKKSKNKDKNKRPNQTQKISPALSALEIKDEIKEEKEEYINVEKVALKKKKVVKENGELVYSKFDFISTNANPSEDRIKKKRKLTPIEMLKNAENHENKLARLEDQGNIKEAVLLSENKKWTNALKRSKGEKVRDDPVLIKKTIKRQDKIKKNHQKKWKERTDMVNKQKDERADKRKKNIQNKKDERSKTKRKNLRKQGRIV